MSPSPSVEFVIPVLNEEGALPGSVERLHGFLREAMQAYDWRIVVADNGSTDRTPLVCEELSRKFMRRSATCGWRSGGEAGRSVRRGLPATPITCATWTWTSRPS